MSELSQWIQSQISHYIFAGETERDVQRLLASQRNLRPSMERYTFMDGHEETMMCLKGTLPISYRGASYNIPVEIWLCIDHPSSAPICYVVPTSTMRVRPSERVDANGMVMLPTLSQWQSGTSNLTDLTQDMVRAFSIQPPVFSQSSSSGATPPPPSQPSQPSHSSYSSSSSSGGGYNAPLPAIPPAAYTTSNLPYPVFGTNNPGTGFPQSNARMQMPSLPNAAEQHRIAQGGYMQQQSWQQSQPQQLQQQQQQPLTQPPVQAKAREAQSNAEADEEQQVLLESIKSAVAERLREKLRNKLSDAEERIQLLQQENRELISGRDQVNRMLANMEEEQVKLEENCVRLDAAMDEIKRNMARLASAGDIPVDQAVTTSTPLYKQLLQMVAEESALEDALYHLANALQHHVIDLPVFVKHVRTLSLRQFMLRAKIKKARDVAHLRDI
ncbi:hypothetical protein CAOG_06268 [Capsaspora owczarzaki ATCC 30864]|uniref:Uncharacterized protein n=1 Tax=Capsaspora owczarzaki (strain ATCC 30864) TaxID=595528 RepID=A0A0D2WTL7_CAPO3|nr:hypothetical protein CAOG_06268 [Capsaspora owczarzaki ATCC 30864]KJE95865.1 hypothetical protein CAOG_006268 [Capsaspora owczarzaki ATCC 30864]|eukprot:XP_004345017.2 hypothetical protein CAOG_06268 [Capsaspora owczarzaki ATCC 30864]